MKVSDLAKEFKISTEDVLATLKSLKLKAKDGKQELSAAVLTVVKSELKKGKPAAKNPDEKAESSAKKAKPATKAVKKKTVKKKVVKKKSVQKKIASESEKPKAKKTKKVVTKRTVKKKVKTVAKKKTAAPVKEKPKAEPFVTLKPLAKKRRKKMQTGDEAKRTDVGDSATSVDGKPDDAVQSAPAEAKSRENFKDLEVNIPISVKEFSVRIQEKPSVVLKQLMQLGIFANINMALEETTVRKLADEFGFNITEIKTKEEQVIDSHKEEEEDPGLLKARAPVVTFMGHVDHGKTSLLDKIRKSKIADAEHGGITQHIGAYSVRLPKGFITFLDTPGHEAFTSMRARGAHITDLVVIVIAADEGIMPQTEEAIDHAMAAEVPIIIALNKIDKKNADLDRVKKQLQDRNLTPEEWGGKTICIGVSAETGEGIDQLLEMMLLEAELLELKANPNKKASGIVVEAHLSQGKGAVADLIVQSGTLHEGDDIVVGGYYGRVKAMKDDRQKSIKDAGPSVPVEILGLPGVPEAGEMFYVVEDEKVGKDIAHRRQEMIKNEKLRANQKITLEELYSQIQEGNVKEIGVIIKADVQGSLEALKDSLEKIPSSEVKLKFIHTGVGDVNLSDVLLAIASKAIIMTFHVGVGPRAKEELEKNPVDVRQYRIIYDAVNDIRNAVEGLLEPKIKKKFLGRVEIREVFKLSRAGTIAGCMVTKGKVHRKDKVDLIRNGETVHSSSLTSLKRFKDDVKEVGEGMECGVSIDGFTDYRVGDIIEAFQVEKIARKL